MPVALDTPPLLWAELAWKRESQGCFLGVGDAEEGAVPCRLLRSLRMRWPWNLYGGLSVAVEASGLPARFSPNILGRRHARSMEKGVIPSPFPQAQSSLVQGASPPTLASGILGDALLLF